VNAFQKEGERPDRPSFSCSSELQVRHLSTLSLYMSTGFVHVPNVMSDAEMSQIEPVSLRHLLRARTRVYSIV
jgi:hypothetical protein